jgi:threonine/homoserine/homoserine lactone efflux protein
MPALTFLPDAATLLAYSLTCLVLFITPGPDMSFMLARTVAGGRMAGFACMAGASLGNIVHSALAALGISALLAASPTGFLALKLVGAGYLLWLAIGALRHGSGLSLEAATDEPPAFWPTFVQAFTVNLANPKVILFFVTFLPQFIAPGDPAAPAKLFFLGNYLVAFCTPLAILLVIGAERVITQLKTKPRVMRAIDWLFAGVFGAFAVKILVTQAR